MCRLVLEPGAEAGQRAAHNDQECPGSLGLCVAGAVELRMLGSLAAQAIQDVLLDSIRPSHVLKLGRELGAQLARLESQDKRAMGHPALLVVVRAGQYRLP